MILHHLNGKMGAKHEGKGNFPYSTQVWSKCDTSIYKCSVHVPCTKTAT